MNIIMRILVGGITGCLIGQLMDGPRYGNALVARYVRGLDLLFGVVGACLAGYLFFWAVIGPGDSFTTFGAAVLGSITLVSVGRLIYAKQFGRV